MLWLAPTLLIRLKLNRNSWGIQFEANGNAAETRSANLWGRCKSATRVSVRATRRRQHKKTNGHGPPSKITFHIHIIDSIQTMKHVSARRECWKPKASSKTSGTVKFVVLSYEWLQQQQQYWGSNKGCGSSRSSINGSGNNRSKLYSCQLCYLCPSKVLLDQIKMHQSKTFIPRAASQL